MKYNIRFIQNKISLIKSLMSRSSKKIPAKFHFLSSKKNQPLNLEGQYKSYGKHNIQGKNENDCEGGYFNPKCITSFGEHKDFLPNSYYDKMRNFETQNYDKKSASQLKLEMSRMRKYMEQWNNLLNHKLDKYELIKIEPKEMLKKNTPEKQQSLIRTQLQVNKKILLEQEREVQKLYKKQRDLAERDYLIEFEERVQKILQKFQKIKKEKHDKDIKIHQLDRKIAQFSENYSDDSCRRMNVLKLQIMFYFKKFHENRRKIQLVEQQYEELRVKDANLTQKYHNLVKQAVDRYLLVKANKNLLEMKKKTNQLLTKVQSQKRKREIQIRSRRWKDDQIEKQMWFMEREKNKVELERQEIFLQNQELEKRIEQMVQKHGISEKKFKKIIQKFPQTSFRRGDYDVKGNNDPFLKIKSRNHKQAQVKHNFKTSQAIEDISEFQLKNDYSQHKSIEMSPKNQFRINIKPKMKIGKKKTENYYESIDLAEIPKKSFDNTAYQPPKLKKILTGRKVKANVAQQKKKLRYS